jgi:hypothetical protein
MIRDRACARILAVALGLGAVADGLFYGNAPGVSVPLFVLLVVGALAVLGWRADVRPARHNLWLIVPLLVCAGMVAWRANGLLTFLNCLAVLVLLGLLAGHWAAGRLDRLGLWGYPLALFLAVANVVVQPAPLIPAGLDLSRARVGGARALLPVLRGLLLALPVLLVFSCLLAFADVVFASLLEHLLDQGVLALLADWGRQGVIILGAAWIVAGGLAYALSRAFRDDADAPEAGAGWRWQPLGAIEAITVLLLVDGLFAVFGWIQFVYLFGGTQNIGVNGYTYAEYARKGFFELVIVAVLSLGLILGLQALTRRATRGQWALFGASATGLVAGVLVLVAAALWRMALYEEAYGYTHLRLYVHFFLIWLGLLFLWFVLTLWTRPARFALGAFGAALGLLITLNVINPDATIAAENLGHHYLQTGRLDTNYLDDLSDDAVPVLVASLPSLAPREQDAVRALLARRRADLADPAVQGWPAYHLARAQAAALLADTPGPTAQR